MYTYFFKPIHLIFVTSREGLDRALTRAGWFPTDPITFKTLWRIIYTSLLNKPYPQAPGTPSFWDVQPNDFAFEKPTSINSVRERQHIHFWKTPLILNDQRAIWFSTAHFDKSIQLKSDIILPTNSIDPAIDKERERIKNDLLKTSYVESIKKFQIVEPTLGSNQAGDYFFTDGMAYVIFIKTPVISIFVIVNTRQ